MSPATSPGTPSRGDIRAYKLTSPRWLPCWADQGLPELSTLPPLSQRHIPAPSRPPPQLTWPLAPPLHPDDVVGWGGTQLPRKVHQRFSQGEFPVYSLFKEDLSKPPPNNVKQKTKTKPGQVGALVGKVLDLKRETKLFSFLNTSLWRTHMGQELL